jgi:hypothetical protein
MSMIFSIDEISTSSATGKLYDKSDQSRVADRKLNGLKLEFISKRFWIHAAKDVFIAGKHDAQLLKNISLRQYYIQNVRKLER